MHQVATAAAFQATIRDEARDLVRRLGVPDSVFGDKGVSARSPITGETIGCLHRTSPDEAKAAIGRAQKAFSVWRRVPAPRRGEFVRLLGQELRAAGEDLGCLVTLETCKILSASVGMVQEMIYSCACAVGLAR